MQRFFVIIGLISLLIWVSCKKEAKHDEIHIDIWKPSRSSVFKAGDQIPFEVAYSGGGEADYITIKLTHEDFYMVMQHPDTFYTIDPSGSIKGMFSPLPLNIDSGIYYLEVGVHLDNDTQKKYRPIVVNGTAAEVSRQITLYHQPPASLVMEVKHQGESHQMALGRGEYVKMIAHNRKLVLATNHPARIRAFDLGSLQLSWEIYDNPARAGITDMLVVDEKYLHYASRNGFIKKYLVETGAPVEGHTAASFDAIPYILSNTENVLVAGFQRTIGGEERIHTFFSQSGAEIAQYEVAHGKLVDIETHSSRTYALTISDDGESTQLALLDPMTGFHTLKTSHAGIRAVKTCRLIDNTLLLYDGSWIYKIHPNNLGLLPLFQHQALKSVLQHPLDGRLWCYSDDKLWIHRGQYPYELIEEIELVEGTESIAFSLSYD